MDNVRGSLRTQMHDVHIWMDGRSEDFFGGKHFYKKDFDKILKKFSKNIQNIFKNILKHFKNIFKNFQKNFNKFSKCLKNFLKEIAKNASF